VAGPWNKIAFSYTDRALDTRYSVYSGGAPVTYFTLPIETRLRKSEDLDLLGAGETLLTYVAQHAASPQGDLLDTTDRVTFYDDHGNILAEERTTEHVDDVRTVERSAQNDENTWLLGEVTKEVACSTALGDQECQTTVRTYNARGEVETEGRGDPANAETTRNTTFTRDDFGNLTLVTADDAFGNHRSACITYEKEGIFPYAFSRAVGQISRVAFDAGLGVPTALKDANGLTTVWQHDAFGRTTQETGADGVVTGLGVQRLKNGGPTHTWYALYPDTTIAGAFRHGQELDSRGRTVRSWAYGPHVPAQNGMNQSTHPLYEEDTTYDLLGRVAQRSKPWMIGDPAGSQLYTQYAYDTLGRTLSVKSPWGYTTRHDYSGNTVVTTMPAAGTMLATTSTIEVDPLGRTISVTDAKLGTTATTYGPFGEPRVVASPSGLFVTVRDAYGRVTREIDPDRGATNIHYNGFDEQSQVVDAANRVVEYVYDSLGRRTQRRDNGALSTTWHYDDPVKGYGRLADVTSIGGATKSYTYDPKGRVSSVALLLSGETFTSQYHYDASGNVDTIAYPQGPGGAQFRIRNEYDEDDNLTGVRDDIDATHPYFWRLTGVNGVGQTSQEIFGNNQVAQGHALVTERDYFTDTGALKAIRTKAGATLVQNLAYSYDARLNLTTRTDWLQQGVNAPKTERFGYDELDRLTSTNLNIACSPPGSCNDSQVLTYAADGNIATKSDVGGGAKYAYDISNLHPHAVASIGSLAYGYDTVGNQTSRPGLTIDYTPFDLPKKYTPTSGDPTPTTFDYDGAETRVRKTTPGDETVYAGAYERVTHFGMQAGPTEHRYYISSNERVVAVVTRTSQDTKAVYLHVDHLGSTDVITDGGAGLVLGTVREWRSYDAFGAKRDPVWGVPGPGGATARTTLGFTSHESEGELGLVNMKGRMFDPKVGRFLSTDPVVSHPSFSQSWNPYSYVLNNPLKFVDPTGFEGAPPGATDERNNPNVQEYFNNPEVRAIIDSGCIGDECKHKLGAVAPTPAATPAAANQDANQPAGDPVPIPPPDEPAKGPWADGVGALLDGLAIGAVPGASIVAEAGMSAGVWHRGSSAARIGRAAGEMIGGFWVGLEGVAIGTGGGAATLTGGGAIVGVPALALAGTLIYAGAVSVGLGGHALMDALMSKGSGDYPKDYASKNTQNTSGKYGSEREARAMVREKLGKDPVEIEPGKFRSADGKWQYRAKPEDLVGHGPNDGPHIHLERLNPDTGEVLYNLHLRW
jgi:RHS repeat-associated protein